MVDSNDSFLREVKEEIEREKLENFWKRYGTLIVGVGAAVIIAVAGFQIWSSMAQRAAQEAGAAYEEALDGVFAKKLDEAAPKFAELSKSGPSGYGMLAGMQFAATLMEQGKKAEAIAEFGKLANRDGGDPLLRSFVELQVAALRLGDADFKEMQNRLDPLIKDDGPWRFNAQELLGIAAVGAGKLDAAKTAFEKIVAEPKAPQAMRQRANLRMLQIAASGGGSAAAVPAKSEDDEAAKGEAASDAEAKAPATDSAPASTK